MPPLFAKKYRSPVKASASIHGGNHFSYLLYSNSLEFFEDGTVLLTKQVDTDSSTCDPADVLFYQNYTITGHYRVSTENLIYCVFETQSWEFQGAFTSTDEKTLVFHNHDKRLNQTWSEIFILAE